MDDSDARVVAEHLGRARRALATYRRFDQAGVDEVVTAVAWAVVEPDNARRLAQVEHEGSGMGNVADKTAKNIHRVFGTIAQLQGQRSVGVLDDDPTLGVTRIAKPKGVFGAFVPVTNTVPGMAQNALAILKGGNAVVFSAPSRTADAARLTAQLMRQQLAKVGAPEDLIVLLEQPTRGMRDALMRQADVVVATGGAGLVRAAYGSGRPALGVGPGNAVTIIDGTGDVAEAVEKIVRGKTFDFATSCSSENAVVVVGEAYELALAELVRRGGQRLDSAAKARLEAVLFEDGHVRDGMAGRSPATLARAAGLDESARFFVVEETGVGPEAPFSGEKLSVVLTVYAAPDLDAAIERVRRVLDYQGRGHSCGIHTTRDEHALRLARAVDVCRVLVNQVQGMSNSGSFGNGLPFTATLGCGSWGGNSLDENLTWEHCVNITRLARPIQRPVPTEAEVFGAFHARWGR